MRTALSPTSRTIVVQGVHLPFPSGTDLRVVGNGTVLRLADHNGPPSSDIPKRYTGARDTTFARIVAREIIGFLSVTDTYIHTYIHTNYFRDSMQN